MKKLILSTLLALTMLYGFSQQSKTNAREYYLIQIYHCTSNQQIKGVDNYLQNTYLPYLHKSGIKKVGVFAPIVNDSAADKKLYVWIPMQTIDVLDKLDQGIEKLDPFAKNEIVDLDNADSSLPYTRIERIVAKSFKYQTQYEKNSSLTKSPDRIYEYRSYESPTENAHLRKVHMFNEGGEITLFKRLNFNALFYSKAIVGDRLPNLIYITSFNNMADRDDHWKAFSASPEWQSISNMPKYAKSVNRNETVLMTARMYADF